MPKKKKSLSTGTDATQDGIGTSPRRKPGIGTTPGGTQDGIGTSPRQKPGIGTTPNGDGQAIADAKKDLKAAKGLSCEINGHKVPIISFSGGNATAEKAEASSGASAYNESTLGHNEISELTLVTFLTPDASAIPDAAKAVAIDGKNERYTIVITELAKDKSTVKTFVYDNCLFTSMNFPAVSSHGSELLKRTSTWKPEILTVS